MEMFLSIILTIVVVFWLIGLIFRVALRAWIIKKQQQFAQQMGGGFGRAAGQQQSAKRPEGEIRVEKTVDDAPKVDKTIGEYVEFEEEKVDNN